MGWTWYRVVGGVGWPVTAAHAMVGEHWQSPGAAACFRSYIKNPRAGGGNQPGGEGREEEVATAGAARSFLGAKVFAVAWWNAGPLEDRVGTMAGVLPRGQFPCPPDRLTSCLPIQVWETVASCSLLPPEASRRPWQKRDAGRDRYQLINCTPSSFRSSCTCSTSRCEL
jgi:hypothetical protein